MKTIKSEGAEFWDENPCGGVWPTYREFMAWIQRTEPYIFNILGKYDWTGKCVLDVGCGQGTTLNFLPQFGANMYGLDMSLGSILSARLGAQELGHAGKTRFLQADAERPPLKSGHFDVVLSIGVLHHTIDTAQGIREIHRLLKPGGQAIVMLYRSENPKWWMVRFLRGCSWLLEKATGKNNMLLSRLRTRKSAGDSSGTALLELFGVPILHAFSNAQARSMFSNFSGVKITNHVPGFRRLADISSILRPFIPLLDWLDRTAQSAWGFYQVIEAQK